MKKRVVVTGLGAVTPLGNSIQTTWENVIRGASGIGRITRFDPSDFPTRIAGEVREFDPLSYLSLKEVHRTDLFIQYALAAALMAIEDARLSFTPASSLRTGVLVGSGRGGAATTEKNMMLLLEKGVRSVSPFFAPMSLVNMAAGYISIRVGAKGPCLDVSTACATGTNAVGEAMKIIQRGDADVMIAGAAEAPITPLILAGFCQAKALSRRNEEPEKASRPFELNRDGFVLSEGAGVLVLEEREYAEKRGAAIYAELRGYGLSSDAFHYARPDPSGDGPARALALALSDADLTADEIDYINAHGTATETNDRVETLAIKKTFGEHARELRVTSSKSMLGHMLGAAGAVEAAITSLAVREGIIPPTINYETADPSCDLDYVPNSALKKEIRAAVSNSLGFGGLNGALVFKKFAIGS